MNKLILISMGVAVAIAANVLHYAFSSELRAVQSGELELRCVINDESRTINPNQVTGLMDGVWLFSNGHARNCAVIKGGDL